MDQSADCVALTVRFFGGAAIEDAGGPVASRAAHRHPLALLALLSTAPGKSMSRDKIMGILWPEADPGGVRHRLNVTVYDVRRALGRDMIASVQDDLRLSSGAVGIDVVRFEDAIARGDQETAIELYRGPFLDGFHLPDSSEFADWAEAERERIARAFARALETGARAARQAGDATRAVRLWRRAVEHDPYGSRPMLGLMTALEAVGERGEALRMAERQTHRLETELGVAQEPSIRALAARLKAALDVDDAAVPRVEIPVPASPRADAEPIEDADVAPAQVTPRGGRLAIPAAVAAALLLLALPWLPTRGGSADELLPDRIVVLPFVVRGSGEYAYLGDGMAEILGTTLDGVGPLRTADPHAVIAFVRESGIDPNDPVAGSRIAERFGAGRYLLGSIVESGGRLQVQATVYRADGTIEARGSAGASRDEEFFEMVDGLTRQLLVPRFDADAERLVRLAVVSSSSLEALKAYLDGEARLREGAFEPAWEAFRRATRADSTFALAWYRMAMAAEWAFQPHDAALAVRRAVELSARLPGRDRLLLVGWDAYARGEADRAEAVYRRILDDRPEEVEAWLQLGEIRFHYAPSRGRTIADSRGAFERVLALDPSHEGARIHLARVAALQRNLEALRLHVGELVRRNTRSQAAFEARSLLAFAAGDAAAADALARELAVEDSYVTLGALLGQFHAGNVQGIEWAAGILAEPERPIEVRTAGLSVLALARLATGRVAEAETAIAATEALDPLRGGELRALTATLPFLPADASALEAALAALDRGETHADGPDSFFLPDHDAVRPLLREYLRGLLLAGLGEPSAALRRAAGLERMTAPASDPALARDFALGIRAEVHRLAGRDADALAALERIEAPPHYELVLPSPFQPRAREGYLRAALLEEAGRSDEAVVALAATGNRSLFDLPYRAPVLRRLAGIHERAGDRAAATAVYGAFVELWQEADAKLQSQVTGAKARLSALAGS